MLGRPFWRSGCAWGRLRLFRRSENVAKTCGLGLEVSNDGPVLGLSAAAMVRGGRLLYAPTSTWARPYRSCP